MVYGLPEDHRKLGLRSPWPWVNSRDFYRRLAPADLVRAADKYRMDQVVILPEQKPAFQGWTPKFEGNGLTVYRVSDLRQPPAKGPRPKVKSSLGKPQRAVTLKSVLPRAPRQ